MQHPPIACTPEILEHLRAGAPVAFGVSGGKDSSALVLTVNPWLDALGHPRERRILIHADLGRIEWPESLPWCEQLAAHSGLELVVVRRGRGDMLARWEQRWSDNVRRYEELRCVTVITPWSTPAMRFCTSELKVAPITTELKRRFPGQHILNVTGIRRQESSNRARSPVAAPQDRLTAKRTGTSGMNWHPILEFTLDDVMAVHEHSGFPLHPAYTRFASTRLSCSMCILASRHDQLAALQHADNHDAYRRITDLELRSTFSFQAKQWAADRRPALLDFPLAVPVAKAKAAERQRLEADIPHHLRLRRGRAQTIPTIDEVKQLAAVRREINDLLGLDCAYLDAAGVRDRYVELLETQPLKTAA